MLHVFPRVLKKVETSTKLISVLNVQMVWTLITNFQFQVQKKMRKVVEERNESLEAKLQRAKVKSSAIRNSHFYQLLTLPYLLLTGQSGWRFLKH